MHIAVASQLIDIEMELRRLSLWQDEVPSAEDLASTQPFAVDTLSLPQWLQFVFLPTMHTLVEERAPLPAKCGIAPMAEEYFRGDKRSITQLLAALEAVDELLTGAKPDYGVKSPRSSR